MLLKLRRLGPTSSPLLLLALSSLGSIGEYCTARNFTIHRTQLSLVSVATRRVRSREPLLPFIPRIITYNFRSPKIGDINFEDYFLLPFFFFFFLFVLYRFIPFKFIFTSGLVKYTVAFPRFTCLRLIRRDSVFIAIGASGK